MHLRIVVASSLIGALAVTTACRDEGKSSVADAFTTTTTSARAGSCDRVLAMSVCSEYAGGYLAQNEAVLSSACGKLNGTFAHAECPNTAVLGTCALSTSEVRKFYASGGAAYDIARAQKECEGPYHGKWRVFGVAGQ